MRLFFNLLLPLHKFRRQVIMQLFFLHMCGLNSHAILQHVDIAGLPINYNETQLLDIKRIQVPTTTSTRHEHGGKQQGLRSLPVSVKDWMSQVKSIFTQSELSSFLKLIPMNHMETNSFLWKKSIKICYKFASSKGQLSSLYTGHLISVPADGKLTLAEHLFTVVLFHGPKINMVLKMLIKR